MTCAVLGEQENRAESYVQSLRNRLLSAPVGGPGKRQVGAASSSSSARSKDNGEEGEREEGEPDSCNSDDDGSSSNPVRVQKDSDSESEIEEEQSACSEQVLDHEDEDEHNAIAIDSACNKQASKPSSESKEDTVRSDAESMDVENKAGCDLLREAIDDDVCQQCGEARGDHPQCHFMLEDLMSLDCPACGRAGLQHTPYGKS